MRTFKRALFFAFAVHLGAGLTLLWHGPTAQGQGHPSLSPIQTAPKPAPPASTTWTVGSATPQHIPYDATWCALLAYDRKTDSFRCADHQGKIIQTQHGDMPICDFLLHDEVSDGFRCAEQTSDGQWHPRVWYAGVDGNDFSHPLPPMCFSPCPTTSAPTP